MRLGPVHLIVNDLEALLGFYQKYLGLSVHWRQKKSAGLGTGAEDLLVLQEDPLAQRNEKGADLYHIALSLPDRKTFAKAVARLMALRWPNSPTDHLVSETTYFEDPEGNITELTLETPERGSLVMPADGSEPYGLGADGKRYSGRDPIDLPELFKLLSPDDDLQAPLPQTVRMHHVHLYVSSLEATRTFYRDVIGMRESSWASAWKMGEFGPEGYPVHMLAYNTWKGEGITPKEVGSLGLKCFSVVLPNLKEVKELLDRYQASGKKSQPFDGGHLLLDPSGLGIVVRTES